MEPTNILVVSTPFLVFFVAKAFSDTHSLTPELGYDTPFKAKRLVTIEMGYVVGHRWKRFIKSLFERYNQR